MKTLKEFKDILVPGSVWKHQCYAWDGKPHLAGNERLEREATRPVYHKQSNAVAFASTDANKPNVSWLYWPKSKDVTFIHHNDGRCVVKINNGDHGFLTYERIE